MAPKKAAPKEAAKKEEKPKKPELSPEMKELKEKEKALVKVSAPDRAALDTQNTKVQGDIDKLQDKLKKVQERIQEKSHGKEEHFRMKEEIRYKLEQFSGKIDELEKERSNLMGGIKDKQTEGRERRNELNTMKKKLGFDDVKQIDAKIREIEWDMQCGSLTLKEEKEKMNQIKELKASKPLVTKYEKMESGVGPVDVTSMRTNIDEIKAQLTEVREAKKLQQAAYSKLIEARQKVMGDVPEMFKEKEEVNGQIRELYQKRQAFRDEFNTANREFNQYLSEVRNLRNERYRLERADKQKEWESTRGERDAEETAAVEIPFYFELQGLENMMRHLKSLQPKEAEESKAAAATLDTSAAPGEVLLAKGAREEEFFFAPTKKKQLKRKGGEKAKAKPLVHKLDVLAFFEEHKVSTPGDSAAIPKALEELAAKVDEFKVKQAKKLEDNKKKAENKAAGKTEEAAPQVAAEPAEAPAAEAAA